MCACSRAPCIAAFLHELGFRSTRSDVSLFVFRHGTETAYLLLYVDDIPDDQHYRSPSTAYYHLRAVLHQGLGASPFTSSVSRWSVERMGSFFTREICGYHDDGLADVDLRRVPIQCQYRPFDWEGVEM
ncbi:hypothetical protein QYE76_038473 [Lolium multiflorum]|uniref:Uncharacterized protein n=1 Tax=Lolium multiflorum TaxID=4521 RepID=A0AAD8WRB2_LOLMU|nr:hypothetical protein QYE76_048130 [Lolium multiflorum]KAK1677625.1 hypothetical protein QYE76_038473 [Lolium multiflorum]